MSVCKMCSVSIAGHRSSLDKTLDVLIKTGVFHPDELKKFYSDKLFKTMVPRSVRLSEAPSYGEPIQYYDGRSKCAEAYNEVARELVLRI